MWFEVSTYLSFWVPYFCLGWLFPADPNGLAVSKRDLFMTLFRNMIITFPFAIFSPLFIPTLTNFSYFGTAAPIFRFLATLLLADFMFYLMHRVLHLPFFYQYHKTHHRFNKAYPYSALYCSPVEALVCDGVSTSLGVLLFGLPQIESCFWFFFVSIYVLIIHSTLRLPYFSGREHTTHHGKIICNFGLFTNIPDYLGRTFI